MKLRLCQSVVLLALSVAFSGERLNAGETKTWNGANGTRWSNGTKWSPNGVPGDGDNVVIPSGKSVLLDVATAQLSEVDISGTVECSTWNSCLLADTIVVSNGGTVTCSGPVDSSNSMCRAYLKGVNVTIASGGKVDVSGKGWKGGIKNSPGYGPGAATFGIGGGSHGGIGSFDNPDVSLLSGLTYGKVAAPETAGSGGWGGTADGGGGAGGGVIRIEASESVTVNGTLAASGGGTVAAWSACGAGGSIYVSCRTFAGEHGVIKADAISPSTSYSAGYHGGGGGRVAIEFDSVAQAALPVPKDMLYSADCSPFHAPDRKSFTQAEIGTLYFSSDRLIDRSGAALFGRLAFANVAAGSVWEVDSFRLTNGWASILHDSITMRVTGDFEITGAQSATRRYNASTGRSTFDTAGTRWEVGPASVAESPTSQAVYPAVSTVPQLTVNGKLKVSTNGVLYVSCCRTPLYADQTDPALTNIGAKVTVSGAIELMERGRVWAASEPYSGASPSFACASFSVSSNSTFCADDLGYFGNYDRGEKTQQPNANSLSPTWPSLKCGGGHGGAGGWCADSSVLIGEAYDSLEWPVLPGSGGHGDYSGGTCGPRGAGVVRVFATGDMVVDGVISANATDTGSFTGNGAGGSVLLSCRTLTGSGRISAAGADGYCYASYKDSKVSHHGGGGGGGRIAIHYDVDLQPTTAAIAFVAPGGAGVGDGVYSGNGEVGTLWFADSKLISGNETFSHKGRIYCPEVLQSLEMSALVLDDGIISLPTGGFINVAGDVTIKGKSTAGCGFELADGWFRCGGNLEVETGHIDVSGGSQSVSNRFEVAGDVRLSHTMLTIDYAAEDGPQAWVKIGGDMVMTNDTSVTIQSPANPTEGEPGCICSARNVKMSEGCWIYPCSHPTNGASVLFRLAEDLICATNAGINATGKGYATTQTRSDQALEMHNWGPRVSASGPVKTDGSALAGDSAASCTGGGYGGKGGQAKEPDETYPFGKGWSWGSYGRPVWPGVGGACNYNEHGTPRGGGLVRVEADKILLNGGSLLADGEVNSYAHRSGGSGGAVYLRVGRFDGGNGLISAKGSDGNVVGGDTPITWACPGGGGGRVAVWCSNVDFATNSVTVTVAGGKPDQNLKDSYDEEVREQRTGADGTVYWCSFGGFFLIIK